MVKMKQVSLPMQATQVSVLQGPKEFSHQTSFWLKKKKTTRL
jgi:hypothetical protein